MCKHSKKSYRYRYNYNYGLKVHTYVYSIDMYNIYKHTKQIEPEIANLNAAYDKTRTKANCEGRKNRT